MLHLSCTVYYAENCNKVLDPLTCWLLGPTPGSGGNHHHSLRIKLDMCSYMYTHSFPSYPLFHCTKHYIAYCFPNANHITFSTQPVVYVTIHNNHATRTQRDTIIVNEMIYASDHARHDIHPYNLQCI